MSLYEIIFKFKGKETLIKCSENEKVYEIFKKNKNLINNELNEFQLYYDGKRIKDDSFIKDLVKQSDKIIIIVKSIIDKINIKYQIIKENKPFVFLFGNEFVEKNRNISNIIYEGKTYELIQLFDVPNYDYLMENGINEITITLTNINKITEICHMFQFSHFLSSDDMSEWNTENIVDMSYLFADCSNLIKIPDISGWNISNVINISDIFNNCNSLMSLPDISM